jgi:hypothetical protein
MAVVFLDEVLVKLNGTSSSKQYLQINGGGASGSLNGQAGVGFRPLNAGSNVHASIEAFENGNASYQTYLTFNTNGSNSDSAPSERMRITSGGNVGIGTTSPSKKLHVKESTSATYAAYIENTIAGGDYLAMIGDAGDNVFEFLSSGTGGEAEMKMYSDGVLKADINADGNSYFNGGNVGIGTASPSGKLHVSSGYLKVEGVGCGIQMPDTSGNPLLALTTDQNTFAGCNIVNGWGNNLNTGVGVGTTRSDGTAFQVRTGITLSSGIATNSGTTRFIVNGNGDVGIGTTTPSNKLDVDGTARFRANTTVDKAFTADMYISSPSGPFGANPGINANVVIPTKFNQITLTFASGLLIGYVCDGEECPEQPENPE